jgi:parallel beta-helix repeat protein
VDLQKPTARLAVCLSAVVVAAAGVIALTNRGPEEGDGQRVEAIASPSQADQPADPIGFADARTVQQVTVPGVTTPDVDVDVDATAEQPTAEAEADPSSTTTPGETDPDDPDDEPTTTTTGADDAADEGDEAAGAPSSTTAAQSSTTVAPTSTTAGGGAGTGRDGDGDGTTTTQTTAAPTTAPPPPSTVASNAPGANQRELYVDGNNGSGHNPGTRERPFRRPIEALTIAEPGTTIYLRGGTYDTNTHGAFAIRRSGTAQNWIRITPYNGERVELRGGGEYGSGFEFLGASYVELSGFVIRGRNDSIHGSGVFIKDRSHDIRVVGNQISNFGGAGISVVESSRFTLVGNDVRDNAFRSHYQGSGISMFKLVGPTNSGGSFSNVISGNYVVHNYNAVPHAGDGRITDGNCIIMDRFDDVGYSGRTLIENNVCAENGGRGVHSYRSSYIVARNNTLYHNMWTSAISAGRGEMTVGEARDVYFYNNLVINRPGVASFIDNNNVNSQFRNNYVASGPPPGQGNQVLPNGTNVFGSTSRGGSVTQFRPVGGSGLAGAADGGLQSSSDLTGRSRPSPGAVGALEP